MNFKKKRCGGKGGPNPPHEEISELGEVPASDFGKVMGLVMKKTGDAADGSLVKKIVQEELNK